MAFDATDFRTETVPAPAKPAIDTANLRLVRDLLAELPPHLFNMREPYEGSCETPACIYGWARTLMGAAGKYITPRDAADWMGIPDDEAADLFGMAVDCERSYVAGLRTSPRFCSKFDATPAQAVQVLDHLIATGKVDWSVISRGEA